MPASGMTAVVMYSDKVGDLYRRVTVPFEKKDLETLETLGVLAIAIFDGETLVGGVWGDTPNELQEGLGYGTDYLAIVWTKAPNVAFFLDRWNDEDLLHVGRLLGNPSGDQVFSPAPSRRHAGEWSVSFQGIFIPLADWKDAMDQMAEFMGAIE